MSFFPSLCSDAAQCPFVLVTVLSRCLLIQGFKKQRVGAKAGAIAMACTNKYPLYIYIDRSIDRYTHTFINSYA
jgi:hypothetical protein